MQEQRAGWPAAGQRRKGSTAICGVPCGGRICHHRTASTNSWTWQELRFDRRHHIMRRAWASSIKRLPPGARLRRQDGGMGCTLFAAPSVLTPRQPLINLLAACWPRASPSWRQMPKASPSLLIQARATFNLHRCWAGPRHCGPESAGGSGPVHWEPLCGLKVGRFAESTCPLWRPARGHECPTAKVACPGRRHRPLPVDSASRFKHRG